MNQPGSDLDLLRHALAWHAEGHGVAIASVLATWGSAPCPAGSQLAVRDDMRFEGSVSGGCVETAVIDEAVTLLGSADPIPRHLTYGVSDDTAFEVGLACGGTVEILLQRLDAGDAQGGIAHQHLEHVVAGALRRRPIALTCALESGQCEVHDLRTVPTSSPPHSLVGRVIACAREDRSGRDGEHFIKVFNPRLRLVIVGAVHIAQHLAAMAQRCNYEVLVVDPREAFLRDRFDDVETLTHWPDRALEALDLDERTAVVTLTHDPKLDDPALHAALGSSVFYIGALGSRRTQAKRRDRLLALGHADEQLARVHGPVGLNVGARNPAEIAVAILGEITATLRGPKASPIGDRSKP